MKNATFREISLALVMSLLLAPFAMGATGSKHTAQSIPPIPASLLLARYVYVTSYDGDLFDPNLLPEDRRAITAVQDALQKSGKFTIVYRVEQAEMVLAVTSRPTEDILAAYDTRGWRSEGQYLWRMTGRNGLQPGETPLVANLVMAFGMVSSERSGPR